METKIQKWVKNASQQKLGKITENKKYNKELALAATVDIDDFMIELDAIELKADKPKIVKESIKSKKERKKVQKIKQPIELSSKLADQSLDIQQEEQHKVVVIEDDEQDKQKEEYVKTIENIPPRNATNQNEEEKYLQKEERTKQDQHYKQLQIVIQDGQSVKKQTLQIQELEKQQEPQLSEQQQLSQSNSAKQNKNNTKGVIYKKIVKERKNQAKMIADIGVQTDDTSDIHGQDILKLIQLEQSFGYALHNFHEKLLRMLDNQI